jgi:hypothetical protein
VFGVDRLDPDNIDVYTNSWTRYADINFYFPTLYHHFTVPDDCSTSFKARVVHTTLPDGWCDMKTGVLANTTFDTSGGYMVAGSVNSLDGDEVFIYASGQPFSHGGYGHQAWGSNTGIRMLRSRKHGFVSLSSGYMSNVHVDQMPQMATQLVRVPSSIAEPYLLLNIRTSNVGFALIELWNPESGQPIEGFSFNQSDLVRGNTLSTASSYDHGKTG